MSDKGKLTLVFEADFRNVDLARASLQGICAEYFAPDDSRGSDLCLAATEAMNNAVEHSGARLIRVEIAKTTEGLRVSVINDGIPFDPTAAAGGLNEESMLELDEGGYGLYLIRELVDGFAYEYRGGCNVWVLRKSISQST